jgi:hypothetical protein
MLNQVTRALAALIKPIASQKAGKAGADRDAMGQAYENLHDQKKEKEPEGSAPEKKDSAPSEKAPAEVIVLQSREKEKSPEEILESRKREIGNSQVWMGLVTELEEQRATQAEPSGKTAGPDAYEKANAGSSKTARTKKGVILDKKAA